MKDFTRKYAVLPRHVALAQTSPHCCLDYAFPCSFCHVKMANCDFCDQAAQMLRQVAAIAVLIRMEEERFCLGVPNLQIRYFFLSKDIFLISS